MCAGRGCMCGDPDGERDGERMARGLASFLVCCYEGLRCQPPPTPPAPRVHLFLCFAQSTLGSGSRFLIAKRGRLVGGIITTHQAEVMEAEVSVGG